MTISATTTKNKRYFTIKTGYESEFDKYILELDDNGQIGKAYFSKEDYCDFAKSMIALTRTTKKR